MNPVNYQCLVSTNPRRNSLIIDVEADDAAEAAFACWCDRGFTGRPHVRPNTGTDRWIVSDGHNIVKVQILRRS